MLLPEKKKQNKTNKIKKNKQNPKTMKTRASSLLSLQYASEIVKCLTLMDWGKFKHKESVSFLEQQRCLKTILFLFLFLLIK